MKNILLVFLLVPLVVRAQIIQIESFMGIGFGASRHEAINIVKNSGAVPGMVDEREELVFIQNLKFDGVPSKQACLKFINNQFFEAIVEFEVDTANFLQRFDWLKMKIVSNYGYGKDFSWFDPPFYRGDGNELLAILTKKGKLCHAWGNTRQITASNFIVLEVCPEKVLRVVFQSHKLAALASRRDEQFVSNNGN